MVKYHHPVCIEAEEAQPPQPGGAGKEGEQASPAPDANAIVALVCAAEATFPPTVRNRPLLGRGPATGPRPGRLRRGGTSRTGMGPAAVEALQRHATGGRTRAWDGMSEAYLDSVPVFADISTRQPRFLESACNIR